MKTLVSLALAVLSVGLCAAQTLPSENAAPGVAVVEKGWRGRSVRNPALDEDPLLPLENQDRSERNRNEVIRQNRIRTAAGKAEAPVPSRNATNRLPPPRPAHRFEYVYRVKIINTGVKKIRGLVWEYVFVDSSNGSEVGRHRFTSRESVRPGKSKTLFAYSTLPPARSVDATKAGEGLEGQHSEQVVIKRIYYDDNSVWERPVEQ